MRLIIIWTLMTGPLDRFRPGDYHDFLSSVARSLTAIADGNANHIGVLRARVNYERRLVRLERARELLEVWARTAGGSFTVTVHHLAIEWTAHVILSYKGTQWFVTRAGHTEVAALELAQSGTFAQAGRWSKGHHTSLIINSYKTSPSNLTTY